MVRRLTISSLILALLLTSCSLPLRDSFSEETVSPTGEDCNETDKAFADLEAIARAKDFSELDQAQAALNKLAERKKVAELNKQMRALDTCNSDIWDSFTEETLLPTSEESNETDKAFAELEAIARAKDFSKLDQAQAALDKLRADKANLDHEQRALSDADLIFTLTVNANCREGPDKRHRVITAELAGKTFPIVGRSEDGNWYFIQLTEIVRCWFANTVGTASGDVSKLKIYYGPPLPTDTPPMACSTHKDKDSCNADTACNWAFTLAGPGYCKTK